MSASRGLVARGVGDALTQIAPSACCCARLRNLTAGSIRPRAVTEWTELICLKQPFAVCGKLVPMFRRYRDAFSLSVADSLQWAAAARTAVESKTNRTIHSLKYASKTRTPRNPGTTRPSEQCALTREQSVRKRTLSALLRAVCAGRRSRKPPILAVSSGSNGGGVLLRGIVRRVARQWPVVDISNDPCRKSNASDYQYG
jgi:hypothetical protein